jgi:hypothetical protein
MVCLRVLDEYNNEIELDYFDLMWANAGNPWSWSDNTHPPILIDWLTINQINNSWDEWVTIHAAAFYDSHVCMLMSSVVPWKKQFDFELYIPRHTETNPLTWNWLYRNVIWRSSIEIEFKKPFVWRFKVNDTLWIPKINTSQDYNVEPILQKACTTSACNYTNWNLWIYMSNNVWSTKASDTVVNEVDDHKFWVYEVTNSNLWSCIWWNIQRQSQDDVCWNFFWWFNARIDSTTDFSALETPRVMSKNMVISYILW